MALALAVAAAGSGLAAAAQLVMLFIDTPLHQQRDLKRAIFPDLSPAFIWSTQAKAWAKADSTSARIGLF